MGFETFSTRWYLTNGVIGIRLYFVYCVKVYATRSYIMCWSTSIVSTCPISTFCVDFFY